MDTTITPPVTPTPSAEPVKPVSPVHPDRNIELQLRHQFSDKELIELGRKMAEAAGLLEQQKDEAKALSAQLKAKCDVTAAKLQEAVVKISTGYELRQTKCVVKYDTPKTGQKSTIRCDTQEVVDVSEMSIAEAQLPLPLEPERQVTLQIPAGAKILDMKGHVVSSPKAEGPKAETSGTVSVPSDQGSRDDAGSENKNQL